MSDERWSFSTEVGVRFAETDAQGIAHHAVFLVWFELARVEYLQAHAGGYQRLRDEGIESTVVEVTCRYLAPARFDERLTIRARCTDLRRVSFRFEYAVERTLTGERIAEGWSLHSVVDGTTLRPVRMPAWLQEAMEAAEAAPLP
jgi:acyl-CoA thioester hydrolase